MTWLCVVGRKELQSLGLVDKSFSQHVQHLKGQKAKDLYNGLPGRRIVRGNLEGEDMRIIDFIHL